MVGNRFQPCRLLLAVLVFSFACHATLSLSPRSECYMLDVDNHFYDFTDWIGKEFQYTDFQDGSTYTLRFCKDMQVRSGQSIINYGRFSPAYSSARDTSDSFVQEYRHGDLKGCENEGYDYSGRGSMVSVISGACPNTKPCQDPYGCICYVESTLSKCLLTLVVGLNYVKLKGPRVFSEFTVGFSPRGKEVVANGLTQWGYDGLHSDYSFTTQQSQVFFYFSAQSTSASNIGKPAYKVYPERGLKVELSGTASNGLPPTVESPTILELDWRCERKASTPYLVNVTIPIADYDPIVFTLGKYCDYEDNVKPTGSSGWATFGFLIFILFVGLTMFCCAGFLYKTRIEDKHGLDALPGFPSILNIIESASGSRSGYVPADDVTNITISHNDSSSGSGNHSQRLPRSSDGPSYGAV
ncbi:uncharacterized protein [Physcomitrium patens]|uniref:Uncharacterized protein n=1 Tax=Physcomitrium patens TaxID=3218 RepID=A0A2K1JC47_PHYPA|nr:uncharacterized protein LOC112292935 [Physcomitrium patens]XP_024397720.1 uncharacterized protein LOC112292935 [Physcomitrium patens]PNR39106.1 hypothetical protein PHYPA_019384 [Physcomitrium patens]|eukprot:XP_024397719.1 uncharacterized protein LOC112292935 [Physcomitrella patens]